MFHTSTYRTPRCPGRPKVAVKTSRTSVSSGEIAERRLQVWSSYTRPKSPKYYCPSPSISPSESLEDNLYATFIFYCILTVRFTYGWLADTSARPSVIIPECLTRYARIMHSIQSSASQPKRTLGKISFINMLCVTRRRSVKAHPVGVIDQLWMLIGECSRLPSSPESYLPCPHSPAFLTAPSWYNV